MEAPVRDIIQRIARHSDWSPRDIAQTLRTEVYADRTAWRKFLEYFLLGAGAAFLVSGAFFFFAFNWAALPRAVKIGLPIAAFTTTSLAGVFAPLPELPRRVLLTSAVVFIGGILAVLGQVYQTGANAYDLFLAWTLLTVPWLAVVRFAPLWLLFVGLINVTFITYTQQLGIEMAYLVTGMLLFGFNLVAWLVVWLLFRRRADFRGLLRLIAFWSVIVATVNISAGAYDDAHGQLGFTLVLATAAYTAWGVLSLRERSIYYLALVGGGTLIAATFLFLRWADFELGFLVAGAFLLGGITGLTQWLSRLNRAWHVR